MLIVASALIIAILSVSIAYWIAGPIWQRDHELKYTISGQQKRMSGAVGEIALICFGAALLAGVDHFATEFSLASLFERHPDASGLTLAAIVTVVFGYGIFTALTARKGEKRRLFATYLAYSPYSIIFFAGCVLLAWLLISDTWINGMVAREQAAAARELLQAGANGDVLTHLERAYIDTQVVLSQVDDRLTPVFMFVSGVLLINFVIRYTPVRHIFRKGAAWITHITTALALLIVVLIGGWVYLFQYSSFIQQFIDTMLPLRDATQAESAYALERFGWMYMTLENDKSLVAFITRLASEWGGVATLLGLLQWISQQVSRRSPPNSDTDKSSV